jgi:hypothetical protein
MKLGKGLLTVINFSLEKSRYSFAVFVVAPL